MRTTLFVLMALLSSCVVVDSSYRKRLLELTKKLKGLNDESKRDLRAVTAGSVHSGSRGIIDNFEKVSSALEKVDSFVSTLQSGADALPIPALQSAAQYIPIVRHVLKAGRETIDTVVKAQKELANGGSLLSVKNLYGSLGVAKTLVSTVVGIFKKLKNPRNQSDNLNQFEAQRNEELSSPRQNFGSAAAQTDYGKIGYFTPSNSVHPSGSPYNPSSVMYSAGNPTYTPSGLRSGTSYGSYLNPSLSSSSPSLAAMRNSPNLASAVANAFSGSSGSHFLSNGGYSPYGTTFAARMVQDVPTLIAMSRSPYSHGK